MGFPSGGGSDWFLGEWRDSPCPPRQPLSPKSFQVQRILPPGHLASSQSGWSCCRRQKDALDSGGRGARGENDPSGKWGFTGRQAGELRKHWVWQRSERRWEGRGSRRRVGLGLCGIPPAGWPGVGKGGPRPNVFLFRPSRQERRRTRRVERGDF